MASTVLSKEVPPAVTMEPQQSTLFYYFCAIPYASIWLTLFRNLIY